jgi:hypothetical protein
MAEFFAREEESACNMCPAQPARFELPIPLPAAGSRGLRRVPSL